MSASPVETDALVIGAGPVGLFQAFQLGLLEISSHIVDALPHAGGQCVELYGDKPIYDIPGVPATTGRGLIASLREQLAPFKPQFHTGEQVATLAREADGRLRLGTSGGTQFLAKTVFIAAGVGAFMPRRLAIEGMASFEGTRLFYHPDALERFAGQTVVVNGGDDAALRTALSLVGQATRVTLLHRRDAFQADDALVDDMRRQVADGALQLLIGQPAGFDGAHLQVAMPDAQTIGLPADALIVCNGISPRLGPVADWGLALERKQIPVDTEKFENNVPGIFAIGDINTYPGKLKLILSGFHEGALAAQKVQRYIYPERRVTFQYTTSSTSLQKKLGVH